MIKLRFTNLTFKVLAVAAVMWFSAGNVWAQGGPGTPCDLEPNAPECDPDYVPVPIDGGASVLVAAGIAYGVKKIRDKRKQNKEEVL